ncbi:hypothetical protein I5442_12520 [Citrobacter freundii]|nr:hypothetical protein [Citrobacter freundii]
MDIETCVNKACGKKFSYVEIGGRMPGSKESEDCSCPYCYTVAFTRRSNGVFKTSKIEKDDD